MTARAARAYAAFGALTCGVAVGLGALASHLAHGASQQRLALAALFAFAHGLALVALATRHTPVSAWTRACFAAGIVLFSGSLALAAALATPTALAPFGGTLWMLGWGILAFDFLRAG